MWKESLTNICEKMTRCLGLWIILLLQFSYSKELKLIYIIGNDQFYQLRKVAVNKTGIYLLDSGSQTVFHYSINGDLISRVSNPGQGPGEFIEPVDIDVTGDTLWILGHTLMRIGEFVSGDFVRSFQMEKMPISFTRINNRFIVGQIFSSSFLSIFSSNGILLDSALLQGAAKRKINGSPFPVFSTLIHMTSSNSHIYITYEYKNAVEKYSPDLRLLKSRKISKKLKEPRVQDGGNNQWFIDGNAIAKDIQYSNGRIYVLWMKQELTVDCEGLSQISVFDEKLRHEMDIVLPDCILGFDIYDGKLYGVCEEPHPKVMVYEIE